MSNEHTTKTCIDWNGYRIEITYVKGWSRIPINGQRLDHIEICCVEPEDHPLPITGTGYRSHFIYEDQLSGYKDAVDYVTQWLDAEATTDAWKRIEANARQGCLFD